MEVDWKQSSFLLSKWYMDCIAEDGEVFIAYAANLRWRSLSFDYSSTLRKCGDDPPRADTSLRNVVMPVQSGGEIRWQNSDTSATWHTKSEPVERMILDCADGRIFWRCVAPLAEAEISFPNDNTIRGLGYCEQTLISIPPWKIPIDQLRWGRFLAEDEYVVWIDWRGSDALTLVVRNGVETIGATVLDDRIDAADGGYSLSLTNPSTLRTGQLSSTAFRSVPLLSNLLSSNGLMMDETKWRSRGSLQSSADTHTKEGWAIHEVVRWLR